MLVPHGYGAEGHLQLWVGAHCDVLPVQLWVRCIQQGSRNEPAVASPSLDFPVLLERQVPSLRYTVLLIPVAQGCRYHFSLWTTNDAGECVELADAECRARPDSLAGGFNVWYGSCFYGKEDKGALGEAFDALPQESRPDVSFLGGDQVYLDTAVATSGWGFAPIPGLSIFKSLRLAALNREEGKAELDRIFSEEYRHNWGNGLHQILRSGNHHFLAGDHEFWNDYPNPPGFFWGLGIASLREIWKASAQSLFDAYQLPAGNASGQFAIGNELEFFYLDTYLQREQGFNAKFTDDVTLARVCTWLRELTCPGVLVLPMPLLTHWHLRKGGNLISRIKKSFAAWRVQWGLGDHSLADTSQYEPLVRAMHDCPQDVVILAGDVHYSRLAQMELNGKQVVEVVSTPLSCLPSAGDKPNTELRLFPDRPVADISATVDYPEAGNFRKKFIGHISSNNFATLNFSRAQQGINMCVQCWSINERTAEGIPEYDWGPVNFLLRRRPVGKGTVATPVAEPVLDAAVAERG